MWKTMGTSSTTLPHPPPKCMVLLGTRCPLKLSISIKVHQGVLRATQHIDFISQVNEALPNYYFIFYCIKLKKVYAKFTDS